MDRRDLLKTIAGTVAGFLGVDALSFAEAPVQSPQHLIPPVLLELLKEKLKLFVKWSEIWGGIAADVDSATWLPAFDIATLCENQRLFNEIATGDDLEQFRRMGLPLVYKVFSNDYVANNFVNFTAMMHPRQQTWWYDDKQGFTANSEEITPRKLFDVFQVNMNDHSRKSFVNNRLKWHLDAATQKYKVVYEIEKDLDFKALDLLNHEHQLISVLSPIIGMELTNWVLDQIVHAVLGNKNFITMSHPFIALDQAVNAIKDSCGYEGNWAVVGEDIAKEFEILSGSDYFMIKKIAEHNGVHIYFNPHQQANRMVVGYKGRTGRLEDAFSGGMTHGVYIAASQTPAILDPETWKPHRGMLVRHDFKFREDNGIGYYAVADIT